MAIKLTDTRVAGLRARKRPHDIRDTALKGFGLRVLPSGRKRYFIHTQHKGKRLWKILGEAGTLGAGEARAQAAALLAALKSDGGAAAGDIPFETVAAEVLTRYARHWKPRTAQANRYYYKNQILPWFKGRPVGAIDHREVRQWLASLHATPAAADRAAPILSVILREAEDLGYRPQDSNPCSGIKRYRRRGRERFLSAAEFTRLAAVLRRHEEARPLHVAALRLLLLTGCRKSEILTLDWRSYREGRLFLPDSKTGPRTIWLSRPARDILDALPRKGRWVFPSGRAKAPICPTSFQHFWQRSRDEADLPDVRLHDLRHSYASVAMMRGESIPTIGRLLGHADPGTTLKYAHLDEAAVIAAAGALGAVLGD